MGPCLGSLSRWNSWVDCRHSSRRNVVVRTTSHFSSKCLYVFFFEMLGIERMDSCCEFGVIVIMKVTTTLVGPKKISTFGQKLRWLKLWSTNNCEVEDLLKWSDQYYTPSASYKWEVALNDFRGIERECKTHAHCIVITSSKAFNGLNEVTYCSASLAWGFSSASLPWWENINLTY